MTRVNNLRPQPGEDAYLQGKSAKWIAVRKRVPNSAEGCLRRRL